MEKSKRILWAITMTISLCLLCWIGVSYIDVISKNNSENQQYSQYNFFEMLVENLNETEYNKAK